MRLMPVNTVAAARSSACRTSATPVAAQAPRHEQAYLPRDMALI